MDEMTIVAVGLLTILALGFVGYPLFRAQKETWAEEPGRDELRGLRSQRDATYSAIKELEFDYQMGKLSEADYRDLEQKYKNKAVAILKQLDSLSAREETALEERVEREVMARRRRRASLSASPSTGGIGAEGPACPACGAAGDPGDRFCARCGAVLALTCPQCGTAYEQDDRFCNKCGQRLPS